MSNTFAYDKWKSKTIQFPHNRISRRIYGRPIWDSWLLMFPIPQPPWVMGKSHIHSHVVSKTKLERGREKDINRIYLHEGREKSTSSFSIQNHKILELLGFQAEKQRVYCVIIRMRGFVLQGVLCTRQSIDWFTGHSQQHKLLKETSLLKFVYALNIDTHFHTI